MLVLVSVLDLVLSTVLPNQDEGTTAFGQCESYIQKAGGDNIFLTVTETISLRCTRSRSRASVWGSTCGITPAVSRGTLVGPRVSEMEKPFNPF